MSKLLRNRWLRWSLLAGVLIALGVGIYCVEQPEPMCVIEGTEIKPAAFAAEGRGLVTLADAGGRRRASGPVQVWNSRTGEKIAHFELNEGKLNWPVFSRDGRYFAAVTTPAQIPQNKDDVVVWALLLLDLSAGTTRRMPIPASANLPPEIRGQTFSAPRFSSTGEWVACLAEFEPKGLRVYENASGRLLDEVECVNGYQFTQEFLLHGIRGKLENTNIGVWSVADRKPLAILKDAGPRWTVTSNGSYCLAECREPDGKKFGQWAVWNLRTGRIDGPFQSELIPGTFPIISGDGRWVAAKCRGRQGNYFELRELPGGRQIATLRAHLPLAMQFSPDGRFLLIEGVDAKATQTMLAVPSLEVLWQQERPALRGAWGGKEVIDSLFSHDSNTIFTDALGRPDVLCMDCATGQIRQAVPLKGETHSQFLSLHMTPNRRSLLVRQAAPLNLPEPFWIPWLQWLLRTRPPVRSNDTTVVLDTNTCRERFRLHGWDATAAMLSDDGRTLVTTHDEDDRRYLRCWDVDAWKPLHLPIGVPAGLGAVIVLLVWWRGRRRKLPQAA